MQSDSGNRRMVSRTTGRKAGVARRLHPFDMFLYKYLPEFYLRAFGALTQQLWQTLAASISVSLSVG